MVAIYVARLSGGFTYRGDQIVDNIICVVLEGGVFAAFGTMAGIIGLVVITLERYFKIVHAIAHRKYYRSWMTSVGVALPWIVGASLILLPIIATTRIAYGRCRRLAFWPNVYMVKVSVDR